MREGLALKGNIIRQPPPCCSAKTHLSPPWRLTSSSSQLSWLLSSPPQSSSQYCSLLCPLVPSGRAGARELIGSLRLTNYVINCCFLLSSSSSCARLVINQFSLFSPSFFSIFCCQSVEDICGDKKTPELIHLLYEN